MYIQVIFFRISISKSKLSITSDINEFVSDSTKKNNASRPSLFLCLISAPTIYK